MGFKYKRGRLTFSKLKRAEKAREKAFVRGTVYAR